MTENTALQAQKRTEPLNRIRQRNAIPAVIYGHGIETQAIAIDSQAFMHTLKKAGSTTIITLNIAGQDYPVLIREIQYHPVKDHVIHVDFYHVRMDEAIRTKVPLVFIGVAPAVKDLSGVLVKNIDELDLEALPKDLPAHIEVSITSLTDFEKVIHVKDIALPSGVTCFDDAETVVALVQPPRSEQELEALSEEVKEDVEAVEGIKKPEEPAEGEGTPEAQSADKAEKKEK